MTIYSTGGRVWEWLELAENFLRKTSRYMSTDHTFEFRKSSVYVYNSDHRTGWVERMLFLKLSVQSRDGSILEINSQIPSISDAVAEDPTEKDFSFSFNR